MALWTRTSEILATLSLGLADGVYCSGSQYRLSRLIQVLLWCLRICPGRYMAFSFLWMSVAAVLATLEISKSDETVLPENGRYFVPGANVLFVSLNSFLICLWCKRQHRHTVPFKCNIKPRSKMSLDLIKSLQQLDLQSWLLKSATLFQSFVSTLKL